MKYCLADFIELSAEAMSFNSSVERLSVLASEEDIFICWCAASNPNTLEKLATDKVFGVRYWVARNPNTPHFIKKSLKFKELLRKL
jgi:hypothetical protein